MHDLQKDYKGMIAMCEKGLQNIMGGLNSITLK